MLQTFRTFCYLLLTLLLVALGLSPPAEAASAAAGVELVAAADGSLRVTEQLILPAYTESCTRRLPLYTAEGQKVIVSDIAISGASLRKTRQGGQLLLQLTPDNTAAEQLVTLTYRYDAGADADDGRDFLYFPLIDADLAPVQQGEFTLTLPRGFTLARCRIISGDSSSDQNRHVEWEMTQEQFSGRLKLPLQAGESVWLQVELPQGYWQGARRNNDVSALILLAAAACSGAHLLVYRRRTGDSAGRGLACAAAVQRRLRNGKAAFAERGKKGAASAAAPPHPPQAVPQPPLCEYSIILSGHPAPAEFALQPLLWEAQGCIAITEDSCGGVVLRQTAPLPPGATAAEKLLWTRLFAGRQGDTAHLSFAAGELRQLLESCRRRTLEAYAAAPLLRSPRRLIALLPSAALTAALLLNCQRIYLRWPATLALSAAAFTLLLLLLLGLSGLLRRGSPAAADAYLIPLPLLLLALTLGTALFSGASLANTALISVAVLWQTWLAARIVTPLSAARRRARSAIAAEQNILKRYLQEKPPAMAKDISCYQRLLPLALITGRAEEWTDFFAAASPPGSGTSPRLLLHRARCLQAALLPAFAEGASPLPQRKAS